MHAKLFHLCLTLCDPMDNNLPGSSIHGILQQEYWNGLPFPSPEYLSNPGIEPESLISPALIGGLLTASTTWYAKYCMEHIANKYSFLFI